VSKDSKIAWTDHTFNPWWGCQAISPGCANCYAETFSKRLGLKLWGSDYPRRSFGPKHWAEPLAWNRAAEAASKRAKVFCASMADVFEDRRDLDAYRARLWPLIAETPWLDWLLLTKRHHDIKILAPEHLPPNVWLGVTAEDQCHAADRWDELSRIDARVRFLSVEPMLGPISFRGFATLPDWVIIGGESGPKARMLDMNAAERLVAECCAASVPVFVKQLGRRPMRMPPMCRGWVQFKTEDAEGRDMSEWPEGLRVQQWPEVKR
jgi:protein gp37